MDRVHYRRVQPSRVRGNPSTPPRCEQENEEPTIAETLILQSIVCGILIVCVLLISLTNLAPATVIRENLNRLLTGAETPEQLLTEARHFSEEFFGWGAEPEQEHIWETPHPPPTPTPTQTQQETQEIQEPPQPYQPAPTPDPLPIPLSAAPPPSQTWITPVSGRISSPSGNRYNPVTGRREFHDGIDIAVPTGTPVIAPRDGEVIAAGFCPGFGYFMRLAHDNNYITFYGHLHRHVAALGDIVEQGTHVAYTGNTGQSTGPHLHFGMFRNGQFVDPLTRVSP